MLTLANHFSRLFFFLFAESTGLNKSENRNSAFADLAAAAVVWIVSVSGVFDGGREVLPRTRARQMTEREWIPSFNEWVRGKE